MANLFVVFTPLQIVIAQQIIRQERLSDNLLMESWWDGYSHFKDIYDLTIINELWAKRLIYKNWACWDNEGADLFRNAIKIKKKANEIERLLLENNIDTIYLADFQNQTNRFTCVWLANQGYKIVFFEEGYSHYVPRPSWAPSKTLVHGAYEKLLDVFYYQPLYHINFAEWRCYPNKDYHGLPISTRYSVIPDIHHEPYDKLLKCEPMVSPKLQEYINDELVFADGKKVLLLTDPMTEVLQPQYRHLYFETISDALDNYREGCIVVKFHPREFLSARETTLNLIKDKGLKYSVLGQRFNIPVELYLQNCKFDEILFFNTSTYFYNGYLFPKAKFVKLLPLLYEKCKKDTAPNLEQMESLLKFVG